MTLSGYRKRCLSCKTKMERRGKTVQGKQRWKCLTCHVSAVKVRSDHRQKRRWSQFTKWLTTKWSLDDFASQENVTVRTLERWFSPFWKTMPEPKKITSIPRILVVDGTVLKRGILTLLIASNGETGVPLFWLPVVRENTEEWMHFFSQLQTSGTPYVVVCDAQKGLLKAVATVYPGVLVQRCLVHVTRQAKLWLTRRPRTIAGVELLTLVRQLSLVRTLHQKRKWLRQFCHWKRRHNNFLKERTEAISGRSWYTHRKLRAVRSLLTNATPDLFRFIRDSSIPRTSNHVEGGLNARLKELRSCHRGMPLRRRLVLCCFYLSMRQKNLH